MRERPLGHSGPRLAAGRMVRPLLLPRSATPPTRRPESPWGQGGRV